MIYNVVRVSGVQQSDSVIHTHGSIIPQILFPFTLCNIDQSYLCYAVKVKVEGAQSCLTLCDPMDYTVYGILQPRILEWVAFPSSRGSSQLRSNAGFPHCRQILYQLNHREAQEYESGSLFLLQGIFPTQESNRFSCTAGRFFTN